MNNHAFSGRTKCCSGCFLTRALPRSGSDGKLCTINIKSLLSSSHLKHKHIVGDIGSRKPVQHFQSHPSQGQLHNRCVALVSLHDSNLVRPFFFNQSPRLLTLVKCLPYVRTAIQYLTNVEWRMGRKERFRQFLPTRWLASKLPSQPH